jgi:hypothetical protein
MGVPLGGNRSFTFFIGGRCCPLGLSAFFFQVFLLEKIMRSEAEQTTTEAGNEKSE